MKKQLLMSLMLMIGCAAIPGSNHVEASAEEAISIDGYIANDLNGKTKGYIDEYNLGSEKCDTPFLGAYDVENFRVSQYSKNTFLMDYILNNTDKDISEAKTSKNSEYGYAYFLNELGSRKYNVSIVEEVYSINSFFDYPFLEKNHPMELKLSINFDTIDIFLNKYIGSETPSFEYPILSIDGVDYLYLSYSSETKKFDYKVHNSRCYLGYKTSSVDNTMSKSGFIYIEIPYRRYIETIRVLTSEGTSINFTENAAIKIFHGWTDETKTKFMPFLLRDFDLDLGELSYTGTNPDYELQSFTIDNTYGIDINSSKKNGKDIKSSFNTNNSFFNLLKQTTSDITFHITGYKFLDKSTNETQLVDFGTFYAFKHITKDQIHTATFNGISDSWGGYRRVAFNVYDNTSKITLDRLSAIYFYYDYIGPFYGEKDDKEKQDGTKGLCITSDDVNKAVEAGSEKNAWAFFNAGNIIKKKDKFGNDFWLTGLKKTDYWFFDWDNEDTPEAIKNGDRSDMFVLVCNETHGNIKFNSLISCVYVDTKGTIINCSSVFPNGVEAPTAIINEDGTISIMDANGNIIDGRVNPDTGVFEDLSGNMWEPPDNIFNPPPRDPKEILKKAISVLLFVAGFVVVVWTISKIGPTVATLINGRKKNE